MIITWHGFSCFSIQTKTAGQDQATLVIDPYDNNTGLRFPRTLTADLVASSEDRSYANNTSAVDGNPFIITNPGEYEVRGIFVYGIDAPREGRGTHRLLFQIAAEGMAITHLGALDRALTSEELEHFENTDILLLPVGGGDVLDPKRAGAIISQIEPRIVIPMFYDLPNIKQKLQKVDGFLKEVGVGKMETVPRLKIERKDLSQEEMEVKVLERN